MTKTDKMRRIELERGMALEEIITDAGARGFSWDELAANLGVSRLTLRKWTRLLGGQAQSKSVILYTPREQ